MKKVLVFALVFCLIASAGFAASRKSKANKSAQTSLSELRFRDVPDSHWASKAVYKLVKMGVTQGYPDGTFRGNKNITRFETALFLAKLAESTGAGGMEKLSAELKSELKDIKADMDAKIPYKISGDYETKLFLGNILANNEGSGIKSPNGPVINYRIKTTLAANPGEGSSFKINLDTMDAGYFGGSQDLAAKLFDVEALLKTDTPVPIAFKAVTGPGPQQHLFSSPVMPSQYGATYIRPYSSLGAAGKAFGANLGFTYTAHNVSTNDAATPGLVGVSQYTGSVSWNIPKFPALKETDLTLSADYFVKNSNASASGSAAFMPKIEMSSRPAEKIKLFAAAGGGAFRSFTKSNLMIKAGIELLDYFNSGTNADINLFLVGGNYLTQPQLLDQWALIGFDPFNRPRGNGAKAIQAHVVQNISDTLSLDLKGNVDLSPDYKYGTGHINSRMTYEAGLYLGSRQASAASA
ncbi:MAG: S-layer homology domain-containing protein, partial [Candidatus Margulisiibacteriota bacterium]